ncbi:phosphate acyltransferase PlsX, partial [candidate division KSB1 bacterium]|nr:phosphate acyltransferase PlsX [candidate division KSB1 bacterium]
AIETELARHFRLQDLKISIVHASEKIEMDESPMIALRKKKDASITVATRLQKEGKVDAVVSAGNTGAVMAASLLGLGRIPGISRPGLGTFLPNINGVSLLIDAGANVDCKPRHLLHFAVMGSIFIERLLGISKPKVGLLNIGEEPGKGNEVSIQTFPLLEKSALNFIGNIEGRDVLKGDVDVIICDGFVGNIVLKFGESFNGVFSLSLKRNIGKRILANIGALLLIPTFKRTKQIFDWEEYGGVPLLGVNGVTIICHGKSSPKAIKNAITEAEKIVREHVNESIHEAINSMQGVEFEP